MAFIDQIVKIYDETPTRRYRVPEWQADIFFKPLTPNELDCARKEVNDNDTTVMLHTQLVILKALDAEGKRLFKNDDATALIEKGFVDVISRIHDEMRKAPTVEDAEKN